MYADMPVNLVRFSSKPIEDISKRGRPQSYPDASLIVFYTVMALKGITAMRAQQTYLFHHAIGPKEGTSQKPVSFESILKFEDRISFSGAYTAAATDILCGVSSLITDMLIKNAPPLLLKSMCFYSHYYYFL